LGIDRGGYSPHVQKQIVYAGVHNTSFAVGRRDLLNLARLTISEKQVERFSERIGQERVDQRDQQVQDFLALPLMEQFATPVAHPPDLAVVSMDGGRLQIRDWPAGETTAHGTAQEPASVAAAAVESPEQPQPTAPPPRAKPVNLARHARLLPGGQPAIQARRSRLSAPAESAPQAQPTESNVVTPLLVEAPPTQSPAVRQPSVETPPAGSMPGAESCREARPSEAVPASKTPNEARPSESAPATETPNEARPAEAVPPLSPVRSGHWREDKIGLLMTMTSEQSLADPCPTIPDHFVNPLRIPKLVRELRKGCAPGADPVADPPETEEENPLPGPEYTPPAVRVKSMVATRRGVEAFGAILATAAFARGFYGAKRKAFLSDGAEANATVRKRWFSDFVAILDFIHVLSYVFAVAMAGRTFAAGWEVYVRWISWVWQGRVAEVITELERRQEELGLPAADESETSPRRVVADGLRYLSNHQDQMHYDEYRRQGLPITSSHVESTVKQFNRRVKGTEKFWSEEGAEAILQLRADYLSETEPMETFWEEREEGATGRRCYRRAM